MAKESYKALDILAKKMVSVAKKCIFRPQI